MRAVDRLARTRDEIEDDIIQALGVDSVTKENVRALAGAMPIIKRLGSFEGNRKANAKFAQRMIRWIEEGRNIKFPKDGMLLEFLFGPQGPIDDSPERFEVATRQAEENYKDLSDRMEVLRLRCQRIIQTGIGSDARVEHLQRSAVVAAIGLCKMAGVLLVWTNPRSVCRQVGCYFYELATGERDHDLVRAWKEIAKRRSRKSR